MLSLPSEFLAQISTISPLFRRRTWLHAQVLILGAVLCPGKRTVCNLLRSVGLSSEMRYHKYHRVLSRSKWSSLRVSERLLGLLIRYLCPGNGPLVFGIDETLERRWGRKIRKRGIYRDAVRSSKSHFVKCSGLRWMSLMLLVVLPWEGGLCWALPFLTALCPSKRYYAQKARAAKKLTDWAWQMIIQLGRWTAALERKVYLVADGTYATFDLLGQAPSVGVDMIVRMRMDARLYHFPTPPPKSKRGPKAKIGKRQSPMEQRLNDPKASWQKATFTHWYGRKNKMMEFISYTALWYKGGITPIPLRWVLIRDPEAKLDPVLIGSTDLELDPKVIISFFVRRWRIEVTFAEVRRHLGVETQRQWSDLAIERSTPALLALFSIITLWANSLYHKGKLPVLATAWYPKKHLTFSDAIAAVRLHIYQKGNFYFSHKNTDMKNLTPKYQDIWKIIVSNVA